MPVEGTPHGFPPSGTDRLAPRADFEQLRHGHGYDHGWVSVAQEHL